MKYKLIKTYPGSPLLGIIVESRNDLNYGGPIISDTQEKLYCSLHKSMVENQPEFWQELEFFDKSEDGIDLYFNDLAYHVYKHGGIWHMNDISIKLEKDHIKSNEIKKWFLSKEKVLEFIKKNNRKKLFTTEDGIDIYIDTITNYPWNQIPYVNMIDFYTGNCDLNSLITQEFAKGNSNYKIFSTKEKVQEWLIENKPLNLSLLDISDIFSTYKHENFLFIIRNKAKEKLGITE